MIQLSPAADLWVSQLPQGKAKDDIQTKVRELIAKYSTPKVFCEILSWLVYRIKEFFQSHLPSIFGKSAWVSIQEEIQSEYCLQAITRGYVLSDSTLPHEKTIKEGVEIAGYNWAGKFLSHILDLQTKDVAPEEWDKDRLESSMARVEKVSNELRLISQQSSSEAMVTEEKK